MNDKEEFLRKLGSIIRTYRESKKISIREMELRIDISRQAISKIEKGEKNITVFTLKKICDGLETTIDEITKNL